MPILNVNTNFAGQSGVTPTFIFIETNDTYDQVKQGGYLNDLVKENIQIREGMLAAVSTKPSRNSRTTRTYLFGIYRTSGGNYSLVASDATVAGTTGVFNGGATTFTFPGLLGLTVNSRGTATIRNSTNIVAIARALPGNDSLFVTFTADPGPNTLVDFNYVLSDSP
jgi:hypothetical protein